MGLSCHGSGAQEKTLAVLTQRIKVDKLAEPVGFYLHLKKIK